MKKFVCALLAATLLVGGAVGCAAEGYYTLPEIREQAKKGWHETYTDKYGRPLQVDIDIEVPEAEMAPVIKACWSKYRRYDIHDEDPNAEIQQARLRGKGATTYLYDFVMGMHVDLDQRYAEDYGNDLTLREMYGFLGELLQEHGFDLQGMDQAFSWEQPWWFTIKYSADKNTGEVLVPAIYYIGLWQKMFGLRILTSAACSFEYPNVPVIEPELAFSMANRPTRFVTIKMFDVDEILAEDIPLCSVDKAIEGAQKMIEDGYIAEISGLSFGYAVYHDPDRNWKGSISGYDVDTWYLVPSWVLYCQRRENRRNGQPPQDFEYPSTKIFVINAQTGEMLDYFDRSLDGGGDSRYKGFIPWEEVR